MSFLSYSQMDTEHWFAPFADAAGNSSAMQSLYISTNRATPFNVTIYNNNVAVGTVSVSKGNPGIFPVVREQIITEDTTQKFIPNKMGLHLVGDYKYFATLRFSVTNHAEIVTSKGKAALGNHFLIYTPENIASTYYFNSTFGITATEDFTNITVSNFKDNTLLSNGTTVGNSTIQNITLNKGESYIYEVISNQTSNNFTGVDVKSDKPITVTNGDFNMAAPNRTNTDVYMDQSIPTDRLGMEYILMKGNGNLETEMEQGVVVATEDNTNVYINGNPTPKNIAKKGDYIYIPSSNYILANSANDAYNMYIRTDKNAYVYQLLGGVDDGLKANSYASGGMNLIPPLACLLPQKIDELAFIDDVPNSQYPDFDTRVNIITQAGSKVLVNGNELSGNNGPFRVPGNSIWETYIYPSARGNITIESNNAVTAGIAGGNNAVGFGGYFAGFNSNPIISKGGDCNSGNITLEVDDTFTSYKWYKNGVPYTKNDDYLDTDGTSYLIHPKDAGNYYVKIIKTHCGTLDSPIYKFENCPVKSTLNFTIGNCDKPLKISPQFTKSTQSIVPSLVKIITQPQYGTVSVDTTTGFISYLPNNASATVDTFTYMITGNDIEFTDYEIVTVNITLKKLTVNNNTSLTSCIINGEGTYNLDTANVTSETDITKFFYENLADPQNSKILDFQNYKSAPKTIYANITSQYGCSEVANIELKGYPIPNIDISKYNSVICDDNLDGTVNVKLSDITPQIVLNATDFNIVYTSSTGEVLPDNFSFSDDTKVNVEVKSKNGCPSAFGIINFKIKNKIELNSVPDVEICDNEIDGNINITLSDYDKFFTTTATATYYRNETDAINKANTISANQIITSDKTFYYRFENATDCPNVGKVNFIFKQPKKSEVLKDITICKEDKINLDAGSEFDTYLWSNGSTKQYSGEVPVGDYWVELGSNGCIYKQTVKVIAAENPTITNIEVVGNSATVNVIGGEAPYSYALDNGTWQTDSNIFSNISRGIHTIFVKGKYNCTPVSKQFLIINLLNVITPNNDGYNDKLDYSDLKIKNNVSIDIFDRYGKSLFTSKNNNFVWDGTSSGRVVPTGTYWYILKWIEPDTNLPISYKGWILVKNRE